MDDVTVPAIELRDVSASAGGFEIVKGASVSFPEGKISMLLGEAGSGKSTVLKVAAGLVVPDSGHVLWKGKDMYWFSRRDEAGFRKGSGFVFQDSALWSNTDIFNNVAMPLRVHRKWMGESEIAALVRSALERVGYDEGTSLRPAELSMGEQKLVSIARAIIADPDLVFMDSPTTGLDEEAEERVMGILGDLSKAGKTVVIATNKSEMAFRHADFIGVIKSGTVPVFGPYDQTVASADESLRGVLSRLRARGARGGKIDKGGSEMSDGRDV